MPRRGSVLVQHASVTGEQLCSTLLVKIRTNPAYCPQELNGYVDGCGDDGYILADAGAAPSARNTILPVFVMHNYTVAHGRLQALADTKYVHLYAFRPLCKDGAGVLKDGGVMYVCDCDGMTRSASILQNTTFSDSTEEGGW